MGLIESSLIKIRRITDLSQVNELQSGLLLYYRILI